MALTAPAFVEFVSEHLPDADVAADILVPEVAGIEPIDEVWPAHPRTDDSIAFIQYTSGSTAQPKGVVVSDGNLRHNAIVMHDRLGLEGLTRFGGWLPLSHDMGLIGLVLLPLLLGQITVLISPLDFLRRPLSWFELIDKHDLSVTAAPNFAYELCVRRLSEDQVRSIDLSRLRRSIVGAEPVDPHAVARFATAAGSMSPSGGGGSGTARTFVNGSRPGSDRWMVLPLTWTVNCDAPTTVAEMRRGAGSSGAGSSPARRRSWRTRYGPRSPTSAGSPARYSATPPESRTLSRPPGGTGEPDSIIGAADSSGARPWPRMRRDISWVAARLGEPLLTEVQAVVPRYALSRPLAATRIVRSTLSGDAVSLGAATLALEGFLSDITGGAAGRR